MVLILPNNNKQVWDVFQNEKGDILMATTTSEECFNTPLEVEFIAIFIGLHFCLLLCVHILLVESDSLLAIQAN